MSFKVILQNPNRYKLVPSTDSFQHWIDTTLHHIPHTLAEHQYQQLCIRIVSTAESAQLNQHFRQKEGPTNILTFTNEIDGKTMITTDDNSLGDIAICADLVANEAKAANITMDAHWAHLTIHGLLHLFGYDHISQCDAEKMESLEIKILDSLDISNPY